MNNKTAALRKVRSLLAKAESTNFPEEAIALTAKAHQLMTAHAIDEARLRADFDVGDDELGATIITLEPPYARVKFSLLHVAAMASGCRTVLGVERDEMTQSDWLNFHDQAGDAARLATMVGHRGDLERAELLYTSLLVQATRLMMAAPAPSTRVRSFRRAFLLGFAQAVGARICTQRDDQAQQEFDYADLLPALADRDQRVEAELDRRFAKVRSIRPTLSNWEGWDAGADAGSRADVGTTHIHTQPAGALG